MKRSLLFFLLFFPLLGLAKYCPACLKTFQAQTIRGQARILYSWLDRTLSGKMRLKLSDTKLLFSKDTVITINGKRIAVDARGAYEFFYTTQQQKQKLLESRLEKIIVDENDVVLKYQYITERRKKASSAYRKLAVPGSTFLPGKYRTLAITLLHFKHHKVESWWEVQYTTRIKPRKSS